MRLKRPHSTYNPHGFDFEAWALAENMRATGTIRNKSGYKKLTNFVYKPSYIIENWREKIGNKISQTLANKPYAGVIRALVVGDDSQITQAQWDVFFKTGIGHLVIDFWFAHHHVGGFGVFIASVYLAALSQFSHALANA